MKATSLRASFLLALIATGCAHQVKIISVPEGARVAVNGKDLGPAPVLYTERSGFPGGAKEIRLELAGYPSVARKEDYRICPTAGNLILDSFGIGFLFGFCLRDEYVYDLTRTEPAR